jgi:hypothetical protein
MASWRKFIGTKGTVGSSDIVPRSGVVLFSHSFNENYQSLELTKVFTELLRELLQD